MVTVGDHITPKTPLIKFSGNDSFDTLHLAKLLSVKNDKILKYLKKKIQDTVKEGDIIAEKKSLFSSIKVKSPITGILGQADLASGTVRILPDKKGELQDLFSPIAGKVVDIGKSFLAIETQHTILNGEKSEGRQISGVLRVLEKDKIGILDYFDDLENSVVLCRYLDDAVVVKFFVMGVKGIISLEPKKDSALTWMSLSESTFEKLSKFANKKIWMRPAEKEIIIVD